MTVKKVFGKFQHDECDHWNKIYKTITRYSINNVFDI